MLKNNFWDITFRPYTQLKLKILKNYLRAWATIIFSKAAEHKEWVTWREIWYIDCFAGRGKYHKDNQNNVVDGSPLIALECANEFQKNLKYKGIKMNCIFVENKKDVVDDLVKFCGPYKGKVNFEIYEQKDFNEVIAEILNKINYHPAFFFIDPDGIKELRKESLEKIVNREGATDILLNYIKGGVERITGLARKKQLNINNSGLQSPDRYIKTIKRLTDFGGLEILKNLDKTERGRLEGWTESLLKGTKLKERAVFDMPYLHKSDNIYYLLFASKEPIAKKIIINIFKKAKSITYHGQTRMDIFNGKEFEV